MARRPKSIRKLLYNDDVLFDIVLHYLFFFHPKCCFGYILRFLPEDSWVD